MASGSSPTSSRFSPLAETEHSGLSRTARLTRGLLCASPIPVMPSSVCTLMMKMLWQPSPIWRTSGNLRTMPSISVIFISAAALLSFSEPWWMRDAAVKRVAYVARDGTCSRPARNGAIA
jgi:hypothetical protein